MKPKCPSCAAEHALERSDVGTMFRCGCGASLKVDSLSSLRVLTMAFSKTRIKESSLPSPAEAQPIPRMNAADIAGKQAGESRFWMWVGIGVVSATMMMSLFFSDDPKIMRNMGLYAVIIGGIFAWTIYCVCWWYSASESERDVYFIERYRALKLKKLGIVNAAIVCRFCQTKGFVRVKEIGSSAEPFTFTYRRVVRCHCENCGMTWDGQQLT